MLAYAANRPIAGKRESSPNALLLVISIHVALLAVVMSAKMDLPAKIWHHTQLIKIPLPPAPPPIQPQQTRPQTKQQIMRIDHPAAPMPPSQPKAGPFFATGGSSGVSLPASGGEGGTDSMPAKPVPSLPQFHDPQLLTPSSELRPPYPASKLASEEEATLHLRLTIDDQGRVVAVEPVGNADREFLASARRFIIAHWRYQPASENGRAVGSVLTVTLRFQLDG